MNNFSDVLILASYNEKSAIDLTNGYIRILTDGGAKLIDHEKLYIDQGKKRLEKYISNFVSDNKVSIVFISDNSCSFRFSLEFFRELRKKSFLAMMVGDAAHFFDIRDVYYGQTMDIVLDTDYTSRYRFKQYGINAISFYSSFDKNFYKKQKNIKKSIDVSFVGALINKFGRITYIDYLKKNKINIECFGSGASTGRLSLENMVDIINKSKINLSFMGLAQSTPITTVYNIDKRCKQMKGRIAEIALCGGFVLSEYISGIEEVFDIDREIVTFNSKQELIDKVRYYLQHDQEREEIAKKGHIRSIRDYDISSSIPRLIADLRVLAKNKKQYDTDILIDNRFMASYSTYRVFMFIKLLKNLCLRNAAEEILLFFKLGKVNLKQLRYYIISEISVIFNRFPLIKSFIKKMIK